MPLVSPSVSVTSADAPVNYGDFLLFTALELAISSFTAAVDESELPDGLGAWWNKMLKTKAVAALKGKGTNVLGGLLITGRTDSQRLFASLFWNCSRSFADHSSSPGWSYLHHSPHWQTPIMKSRQMFRFVFIASISSTAGFTG